MTVKILTVYPTCEVVSDVHMKFCSIFGKFKHGAIKYLFRIENRSSSLVDSRGGGRHPHIGGGVWEYPIGERVK